jgi:2,3-bisphosphoglycerate-independent phosphoglycerate mutase
MQQRHRGSLIPAATTRRGSKPPGMPALRCRPTLCIRFSFAMTRPVHRPLVLTILDGWGYSEETLYNAIHSARKPCWDALWAACPRLLISASGADVGLPCDQMGNSEVGHTHIGAGRTVNQDFTRISDSIEDGSFLRNEALRAPFQAAAASGRTVHLMGLLSPGGVHSHQDHLFALIRMAADLGVEDIAIHAFLDGRDMPPRSAADSLRDVQMLCRSLGRGRIASLIGRYYAMDRNHRWERTQAAWRLMVDGHALTTATDPLIALDEAYARDESDEFVAPTLMVDRKGRSQRIEDGDVVVFFNYRADRARQLTQAFIDPAFAHFDQERRPKLAAFVTLTGYSDDFHCPVAFPPERLSNTFGEVIAKAGMRQLRIAETEKYAHVTFFFNGGDEQVFAGEDRVLIPSPHVSTYDLAPEMSAVEVTDALLEAIAADRYDVVICNYANADMVGHSGNFEAAVRAIETLDACLARLVAKLREVGGEMLITADHGNAEKMRAVSTKKELGQPHTAHTTNLVPLVFVGREAEVVPAATGIAGTLSDIAPTLLHLLGLPQPAEMTGHALFRVADEGAATPSGKPAERPDDANDGSDTPGPAQQPPAAAGVGP